MQLAIALMLLHLLSPIVYLHLGDASLALLAFTYAAIRLSRFDIARKDCCLFA